MDAAELRVHRLNTEAFINADPVSLVLYRTTRTRTASGGYKDSEAPLASPQTFRLIPASDRMPEIRDSNGRAVVPVYTLLGSHSADMERWDRFQLNGVWYEIASPIRPEHTTTSVYERKGDVVRREAVQ